VIASWLKVFIYRQQEITMAVSSQQALRICTFKIEKVFEKADQHAGANRLRGIL
jgi:hypothetical protein